MKCRNCDRDYHYCCSCGIGGKEEGAMSSGFCSIACAKAFSRRVADAKRVGKGEGKDGASNA